jgi:KDO2-lipid IV(A) lauroyltransferase
MIRTGFRKIFHQTFTVPLEGIAFSLLMIFLRILPFKKATFVMKKFVQCIGPYLPNYRYALMNLRAVLPELQADHPKILHQMWGNLGCVVAEYAHLHYFKNAPSKIIEIQGKEYLEEMIKDGKPGILITAHLANWEMVSLTAGEAGLNFSQLYRPTNNPIVDQWFRYFQYSKTENILTKGNNGAREAYSLLKKGGHLLLLIDQKLNTGISVPFFGKPAMTAPAVAKFALRLKCPVIPVQVIRLKEESRFKVIYHPPLSIEETGDMEKDTYHMMEKINHLLEQWILQHPEQWFWVHRRWGKII